MGSELGAPGKEPPAYGEVSRGALARLPGSGAQIGPIASALLTMRLSSDDPKVASAKLTTFVHINNTTPFETLQRQVRQRYLESTWNSTRHSFTWELWFMYSNETSTFVDEESWPTAQLELLAHSYQADQGAGLLVATYTKTKWNPRGAPRNTERLRVLIESFGKSEGRLGRGGRHVPPPILGCCD
ncbi:hypothetical protein CLAFUW4_02463 [Fulvia fulva]|uniref:Uncharacterized protein n=1 Tax=Passalora fulva TaxID=5499 RepID=A0A9Q8LAI2_PASFU|nr:uncharacterized protein CLAFUR5_02453 [Fulvia fulva]KAK4632075.1 hypothetical protein CLAFUR4_02458 [Fulvia fulva]KAK4632507.1 hypothetical protein CLAFUR0_02462 [Fulvia fulva]UJO13704.1 hypothetical protein CLAFUR5_02453 [Fulvia fulva]WPV11733.1 hypothetical protein CLAFUW4_02463 [Fulvia fulva]WPV26553.1 hypothetical protein CLAFUW7_02463 [Fulvia fulva]